ncbi:MULTISPECIES: hypothetical protein [unclassified Kitasatospora]|uniref:hypothetical protein n=1 Tax=unclassified Kitasatospora TaxID=2633591 RepID=UPI0038308656
MERVAAEEIPGARAELRRRGERLYAEFAALLEELAPGRAPVAEFPAYPDVVSGGRPLSFGYYRQVSFADPPNRPGLRERAEVLLSAWELTVSRSDSGSVVLHARRADARIRLHFHPRRGLTLCRADTEPMAIHRPEEPGVAEPVAPPGRRSSGAGRGGGQ